MNRLFMIYDRGTNEPLLAVDTEYVEFSQLQDLIKKALDEYENDNQDKSVTSYLEKQLDDVGAKYYYISHLYLTI